MAGKPGRPRNLPPISDHTYDHEKGYVVNKKGEVRIDSWQNWVTGVGNPQFDKTVNSFYQKDIRTDDDQLSGLYYGNDLAKLIVDAYVDEAFRCGYEINLPDDEDNAQKDQLDEWKPAIDTAARDLLRWSRLFGGAAIYLDVEDGKSLVEPLEVDKVTKINSLRVFDRRYVWPLGYDSDPTSPTYWLPEYYGFGGSLTGSIFSPRVHHSRLLRAVGIEADRREAQYLFWWGHSVIQPVYQALLRFGLSEASVVTMMQDATQFIFYIQGLIDSVTNGDAGAIQQRMQLIDMQRSSNRALLLDAGDGSGTNESERAEKQTTPFTGVADMLQFLMSRIAAAARMPVSILFGTGLGKGGIGNQGEGDLRTWHSQIQSYQKREVEPILRRMYALVAASLGVDISKMKFNWAQLYEPTAAEFADIYSKMATGDQIYMQEGALRPEEVAISRFGSGKYSTETSIDVGMYRAALMLAPAPQPAAPPGAPAGMPQGTAPPGAPGVGQPPVPGATNAGPAAPPAAGPPVEKPDVNAAHPDDGKHPQEGPLAAGEVGGSSKTAAEPQIVDLTGRGSPNGDREPNKLPADASGTTPSDTPVQAKGPASDQVVPAGDQGPKKTKPKGPQGDEISVKSGDTTIKVKKGKPYGK